MEDILKDINAVVGVTGSFVCDQEGKMVARALAVGFDQPKLEAVGRTLVQTFSGMEMSRRRKVGDIDMTFGEGRLIAKNLTPGCLCILCVRRINVPLVNLTANVAVKKLKALRKDQHEEAEAVHAVASPAPSQAAGAVLDGKVFSQIERELGRAIGSEAALVIYYEVAAMGVTKSAFPRSRMGELIARVSAEIDDESKRAQFEASAEKILAAA